MDEWHYQRGVTTFGPINGAMLHSLIKRGRLQHDTRVRRSGATEWSAVSQALPSLPPAPDAQPPSPEEPANALPYDSNLPGASAVYAPPQSALVALPQTKLPAALWFGVIFSSAALLFEIICWSSVALIQLSHFVGTAQWPKGFQALVRALTQWPGFEPALISTAVGMIATAVWQGCAFASLKHLYGGLVRRSRASGLWWFVPIANLFKPLLCLRDMRYLSRKRRDVPNPHAPFGPLLITMEALTLMRFPINLMEALSSRHDTDARNVTGLDLVRDFAIIAFAMTLLAIVIANFLQQRRLYAHWNDDAYWQNRSRR